MRQLLGLNPDVAEAPEPEPSALSDDDDSDPLLDDIDALLARTDALLKGVTSEPRKPKPLPRDTLIYEDDWDEAERLQEWREIFDSTRHLPPLLRAAIMHDAWFSMQVVQRSSWIGRLLTASFLNQPIEVAELRKRLAHMLDLGGVPQLLLRIGRGPHTPHSPRRPLDEVVS